MFEQATITHQRRSWTLVLSLSLQSAAAGAIVLLSVLSIDRLPDVALPVALPPLPRAPKAVEVVMTDVVRTARAAASNVFTAPARIPSRIAMILEDTAGADVPPAATGGLTGTGLPGGVYSGTVLPGDGAFAPPPPPPKPAVSTRPAEAPGTVRLGGKVMEAKIVKRIVPVYPPLARNMRVSGTVRLEGIIAKDGTVREMKVLSGHPLLVQAALEAVRQWLYQPTLLNDQPVEVNAPIEVHFTLAQ